MNDDEFEDLRRAIERAVRRSCPRWLAGEAEDLAQQVTVKLLQLLQRRSGDQPLLPTYVWRAAHSEIVDEIRRRRVRRQSDNDDGDLNALPDRDMPRPDRRLESRRLGDAIADCLRGVIGPRRRAVLLHLQGHPLREVADLLGSGTKRADNLLYRGLGDLRDCLSNKGYGP